jgi:hypothetical protein
VKDLVLGAKVDLNTCTIHCTSIIEIHGDFRYTKCGSGGSVFRSKNGAHFPAFTYLPKYAVRPKANCHVCKTSFKMSGK